MQLVTWTLTGTQVYVYPDRDPSIAEASELPNWKYPLWVPCFGSTVESTTDQEYDPSQVITELFVASYAPRHDPERVSTRNSKSQGATQKKQIYYGDPPCNIGPPK